MFIDGVIFGIVLMYWLAITFGEVSFWGRKVTNRWLRTLMSLGLLAELLWLGYKNMGM